MTAIAQALYTDPLDAARYVYRLVAKSPALAESDAQRFSRSAGISNYLHALTNRERRFYSFFPLPSGQFGFVHRFVTDASRRNANQVVAHLLSLPLELLDRISDDVLTLAEAGRLRLYGTTMPASSAAFVDLGRLIMSDGIDKLGGELPDLDIVLPVNNLAATLSARRDRLLKQGWPAPLIQGLLMTILGALTTPKRVLLPQGPEFEELLILSWQLLPSVDRRRTPWTTHLTQGSVEFHLACVDDPARYARTEIRDPHAWRVLTTDDLATITRQTQSVPPIIGRLCEALIQGDEAFLDRFHAISQKHDWGLLDKSSALSRHLAVDDLRVGFEDVKNLRRAIERYKKDRVQDWKCPADDADTAPLQSACVTAVRCRLGLEQNLTRVKEILIGAQPDDQAAWASRLLTLPALEAVTTTGQPAVILWGVALWYTSPCYEESGYTERRRVFDMLDAVMAHVDDGGATLLMANLALDVIIAADTEKRLQDSSLEVPMQRFQDNLTQRPEQLLTPVVEAVVDNEALTFDIPFKLVLPLVKEVGTAADKAKLIPYLLRRLAPSLATSQQLEKTLLTVYEDLMELADPRDADAVSGVKACADAVLNDFGEQVSTWSSAITAAYGWLVRGEQAKLVRVLQLGVWRCLAAPSTIGQAVPQALLEWIPVKSPSERENVLRLWQERLRLFDANVCEPVLALLEEYEAASHDPQQRFKCQLRQLARHRSSMIVAASDPKGHAWLVNEMVDQGWSLGIEVPKLSEFISRYAEHIDWTLENLYSYLTEQYVFSRTQLDRSVPDIYRSSVAGRKGQSPYMRPRARPLTAKVLAYWSSQ